LFVEIRQVLEHIAKREIEGLDTQAIMAWSIARKKASSLARRLARHLNLRSQTLSETFRDTEGHRRTQAHVHIRVGMNHDKTILHWPR